MLIPRSFLVAAIPFLLSSYAFQTVNADEVSEGNMLAKAADAQLRGYNSSTVDLTMELIASNGKTASRSLRVKSLETDTGEYTLMVFDTPRDIAGSALLSHNYRTQDDQQWLYLPAIRRVKQIASKDKSGPFMGSEFAYEDIVTPFYEKFTYKYQSDEACGKLTCAVVERVPKDVNSGYTRQQVWIDKTRHLIRKISYYNRRNELLKTYTATGFKQYQGGHWRPNTITMTNHQNKRQTRLRWQDFEFDVKLSSKDFTQNALIRTR